VDVEILRAHRRADRGAEVERPPARSALANLLADQYIARTDADARRPHARWDHRGVELGEVVAFVR
jgi:hypothetical protein